jgi:hypothetical protein
MEGAEDVLILYSSNESVPTSVHRDGKRYLQSGDKKLSNCKSCPVAATASKKKNHNAWLSYLNGQAHIFINLCMSLLKKMVNTPKYETEPIDSKLPLRYVPCSQ